MRTKILDVQDHSLAHQLHALVVGVRSGDAPREVRAPRPEATVLAALNDHRVPGQRDLPSMPACLRMLFSVPGGNVALGFPAIVAVPGFVGCLN